ncbi:RES family NAD+ phosphorylase [Calothrix sp. PCC 7507]|uniref:RES family NAD+ phosphorylase n=1 Tax=Calothrix sp. PCC 7507 TaxID=99598 RepID=UPI00029EE42D|nr:RES family NAD+ phosphorylase [Calothrix sp. PCC 7507]AFY32849.1 RES domain-containing protein [Calothrix sp. PCC 7507]
MVKLIVPPPCLGKPKPKFYCLKKGTEVVRIFRPEFNPTAVTFRFWGPLYRFDHHRGNCPNFCYQLLDCQQCNDRERGIYYVAPQLSSCLVEIFGDVDCIEITDHQVAIVTVTQDLKLLDIRGSGAMRAGANETTLAKTEKRSLSQAWSRYFYEQQTIYSEVHGLIYYNAHNGEEAIALYERAQNFLVCKPENVMPLKHELLRGLVLKAADENNLEVIPYW